MILNFKQYSYGGEYTEYSVDFPRNTIISEIDQLTVSYKINLEKDIWTKDYLILTDYDENLSTKLFCYNSLVIKDTMLIILKSIELLDDYPIICIENFPKDELKMVYLKKFENDEINLKKIDVNNWRTAEYQELVNKYSNILLRSSKFLGFTTEGLKVATVWFKGALYFQDLPAFEVQVITYRTMNKYKVYTDRKSDKEFKDRVTELLNIDNYEIN